MTRKIRLTDRNGRLVLFACGMTEDCLQLMTGEGGDYRGGLTFDNSW